MIFVTLKQASDHLRLDIDLEPAGSPTVEDPRQADLELKIEQAEYAVFEFMKVEQSGSPPEWPYDETTVPPPVRAAALIVLAKLWDRNGTPFEDGSAEASLLAGRRDPTLA